MPPTLRSTTSAPNSAQNTPTKSTIASRESSPSTTPRKQPQCSKCKRPRAGHPRSGCPYADSPLRDNAPSNESTASSEENITTALDSMKLASYTIREEREEDMKSTIRARRRSSIQPAKPVPSQSLMSLSSTSGEIVAKLTQPGWFDDEEPLPDAIPREDRRAKVVRWQETMTTITPIPAKVKVRTFSGTPMPGTFYPLTPDSSLASLQSQGQQDQINIVPLPASSNESTSSDGGKSSANGSASDNSSARGASPLARTMSLDEREAFISSLTQLSSATVYVLPKGDLAPIADAAAKLKFHSCALYNERKDDPHGLLVLGESEDAVQKVKEKVDEMDKRKWLQQLVQQQQTDGKSGRSSHLRAVAGGAVVGAVGTFAGLAFS